MKQFLIILLVFPFFTNAQNEDSIYIRKIADEIMVNGQAYNNLHYLTKKIGGRLTASPQTYKAEAWGHAIMKASGADTVFEQECTVKHWVRGGQDKATILSIDEKKIHRPLSVAALGNTIGSGGKAVKAEILSVQSYDELDARKDEVKGKIVFYNFPFNDKYIQPGNAYGEAGKYRYAGASKAAKYGAVACIVRSLSQAVDNFPHTGAMGYNDSFPKIPAIAIGLRDADSLFGICKHNKHVQVSIITNGRFLSDTIAHNIIAELKGTEHPEEIITVGGHLDSWDMAEGAHDDGAGVVHTIEVLRVLKKLGYRPKHTIRFVLFANEENGLRGGKMYAQKAKENHEKHLFALESDEGGFTPRGFSFTTDKEKFDKLKTWSPLFEPYFGSQFTVGGGGADIGSLRENSSVTLASFTPDGQRYFDYHHAKSDIFENVNKRELHLGAVNIAALIYLVDKYGL